MSATGREEPPSLEFAVTDVLPLGRTALNFRIRVDARGRAITGLSLKVHVRIRAELRRYSEEEKARLWELFGPSEQWGRSLGAVPMATVAHGVGPFLSTTTTELPVPCNFDPGAAAPKYLGAIEKGLVPLELLFSGTLSWMASGGRPYTAMIPWDRDAAFRMPAAVWRRVESAR